MRRLRSMNPVEEGRDQVETLDEARRPSMARLNRYIHVLPSGRVLKIVGDDSEPVAGAAPA
jgi:hypothetical protein